MKLEDEGRVVRGRRWNWWLWWRDLREKMVVVEGFEKLKKMVVCFSGGDGEIEEEGGRRKRWEVLCGWLRWWMW